MTGDLDPRPDLKADHHYWGVLLKEAKVISTHCFNILKEIRCGGGRLVVKKGQLKLKPRLGKTHKWQTQQEWKEEREKKLLPKKELLKVIFKRASNSNL